MTLKRARRPIVIACFLTGVLPTGAVLAQRAAEPQLQSFPGSFFRADGVASLLTFEELLRVSPFQLEVAPEALPWFRRTFELIRTDVTRPMQPVVLAPPPESLEPPGVVQNLRRVDTR